MAKNNTVTTIAIIALLLLAFRKTKKGSVIVDPLDEGEYLDDNHNLIKLPSGSGGMVRSEIVEGDAMDFARKVNGFYKKIGSNPVLKQIPTTI